MANQSSARLEARPDGGRRSDPAGAADPDRRQGEPERGAAARLRRSIRSTATATGSIPASPAWNRDWIPSPARSPGKVPPRLRAATPSPAAEPQAAQTPAPAVAPVATTPAGPSTSEKPAASRRPSEAAPGRGFVSCQGSAKGSRARIEPRRRAARRPKSTEGRQQRRLTTAKSDTAKAETAKPTPRPTTGPIPQRSMSPKPADATPATPLVASKSFMAPPDPAAAKLIDRPSRSAR